MAMLPPILDDPGRRARFDEPPRGRREPPRPSIPSSSETRGKLIIDSVLWAGCLTFLLGFAITLADLLFR